MQADPKLYQDLIETAPCGYLSTYPDGRIIHANRTFLDWTGYGPEALQGGKRFQDLLTISGKIYHDTHFGPLLQMRHSVKEIAFDLVCPGREPLPVLVNAVQKQAEGERPAQTLITLFDATDRRQYERELLLARRQAEAAVDAERIARKHAEQASRIKDEFLAMISHELRTPLNAILGWTQILQMGEGLTDEVREGLGVIDRNARVQTQLVEDLLDMGRIVSGKMRLDVQQVNLAEAVSAAIDTARPAASMRSIRLQQVLDPGVIISGDPGRLQQVFWNLLSNAIKFTPKGGFVRVVMQRINSHVEVSVIDSGCGMSAGFIAHAFERFHQSDSADTRKLGGLGLGLSIVKSLVEMHGGSVHAHSEGENEGSTFVVHLPVTVLHNGTDDKTRTHPRAIVAGGMRREQRPSIKGVRVLVVDDDQDARELVRRALSDAGAEVVTAAAVPEAMERLTTFGPDVLVSDIGLPGEDGYELIRRVRMSGEGFGRVQAVALTAFARIEDRTQAMLAGFQMHLAKPVDSRELVITVASLANRADR